MRTAGIRSQTGINVRARDDNIMKPTCTSWHSPTTTVVDLFARMVVGWSMKRTVSRELAIDTLLMAVWRRKPKSPVLGHSDLGNQYCSDDSRRFCKANNLEPSMSRRGNCWDDAMAESYFRNLKKEGFRRSIYKTRDFARADIFDYIEVFYNRNRRHSHLGGVSPKAFERASK
jgi:putative transposase